MVRLTLMTYNVFSGRTLDGRYDLDGKIEAIRAVSPDILGLNEIHRNTNHSGYTSQTDIIADALGYKYRFFARAIDHDGGEYGIALMTRFPLLKCCVVPVPDAPPDERKRFFEPRVHIDAELNADGNMIHVLTSHYGLTRTEQACAVAETIRLSQNDMPTVFMGDLNAEPDNTVLGPLFKRFRDTADGLGQTETLTFRSDAPDRRIDYIFVTSDFKNIRMYVPSVTASDHRPVAAEVIL